MSGVNDSGIICIQWNRKPRLSYVSLFDNSSKTLGYTILSMPVKGNDQADQIQTENNFIIHNKCIK